MTTNHTSMTKKARTANRRLAKKRVQCLNEDLAHVPKRLE